MNYIIINDNKQKQRIIRDILEALPEWFEIPEGREQYISESIEQLCFGAFDDNTPIGFLCLKET